MGVDVPASTPVLCKFPKTRSEEYVAAEHAKHFILAPCDEFQDNLIIFLNGSPYFQASAVTDLAIRDDVA